MFAFPLTCSCSCSCSRLPMYRNETHTLHYILAKTSSPQLTEYQERVATGRLEGEGSSWDELRVKNNETEEDDDRHPPSGSSPDWSR